MNHQILDAASKLAAILEVELKILTAIEVPTLLADLDLVDPVSDAREAKADMAKQVHEVIRTSQCIVGVLRSRLHEIHGRALQVFRGRF